MWQLERAQAKRALQAAMDTAARLPVLELNPASPVDERLMYRRVRVQGRFDAGRQIYLDNRVHRGRAGYHALAPLDYGGRWLLVNRGWLPASPERRHAPAAPPPHGEVVVEGVLVPARSRYRHLSDQVVEGAVWQNLDPDRYRAATGLPLPELMLQQTGPAGDGLIRDWPRPDARVERHLVYAGQWFALGAVLAGLTLYHGLWRRHG